MQSALSGALSRSIIIVVSMTVDMTAARTTEGVSPVITANSIHPLRTTRLMSRKGRRTQRHITYSSRGKAARRRAKVTTPPPPTA